MSDGYVTINVEANTKNFEKQIDEVEGRLEEIDLMLSSPKEFNLTESDITKLNIEAEKLNNKLTILRRKQDEINNAGLSKIRTSMDKVGNSLNGVIKKTVRWGLAIFGVRSAYMFIRQSMSILSEQNEQLAADLNYIRYALASTLEPVIKRIVELVYKLLQYLGYIIYRWTGKNIFENANQSLENAAGNAKELKKQLAGFDEMNVLSDNSGSGSGGILPSVDLSQMQGEIPGWIKWIAENGDLVKGILFGIAGALAAMKIFEFAKGLGLVTGHLSVLKGLGIFAVILSLYEIITKLKDIWEKFDSTVDDNNTTMKDWGEVVKWVGIGLLGLAAIIASIPVAVVAAVVLIIGIIMKYWGEIKEFIGTKIFGWIDEKIERLKGSFIGNLLGGILEQTKLTIIDLINVFDGLFIGLKQIFDGIILLFKGDFKEGLISIAKGIVNGIIAIINLSIGALNAVINPIGGVINSIAMALGKKTPMKRWRIPLIPYLAKGGLINMPGKGVPIGGAIGGERGPEGVIPLTDSQQMDLLGQAIARHMVVNLTNVNQMDGRVISRAMKKINTESDFAFNR